MKDIRLHSIPLLEETGLVKAFYTDSSCTCWTYGEGDTLDNERSLAHRLGISADRIVRIYQKHTAVVLPVTGEDGGNRVLREGSLFGDGLITNEKGLLLATVEADCVPVYFLDPVRKAVGMVHSGWRGTAAEISGECLSRMTERYGSDPRDVLCAFGPCICRDCYEVDEVLPKAFGEKFSPAELAGIFTPLGGGKYLCDLKAAIRCTLTRHGVSRVWDGGLCTRCDTRFPSYRRSGAACGRMLTGILLN